MMELLDHVVTLWAGWMGPMLLQSSVLVAAVALVDLLLRRWAWPQVRAALWTLVLVKLVLPPGWALPTAIVPQLERDLRVADDDRRPVVDEAGLMGVGRLSPQLANLCADPFVSYHAYGHGQRKNSPQLMCSALSTSSSRAHVTYLTLII